MATMFKLQPNTSSTGIEVVFAGRPPEDVRNTLKGNGFRWAKRSKVWYRRYNGLEPEALTLLTQNVLKSKGCVEGAFEVTAPAAVGLITDATTRKVLVAFREAKNSLPRSVTVKDFADAAILLGCEALKVSDYAPLVIPLLEKNGGQPE